MWIYRCGIIDKTLNRYQILKFQLPEPIKNLIDILFYSPSGTILWGLSGFLIGNRVAIGRDRESISRELEMNS